MLPSRSLPLRAGADITQTFTYYSRDVGTPDDVNLTVSSNLGHSMVRFLNLSRFLKKHWRSYYKGIEFVVRSQFLSK